MRLGAGLLATLWLVSTAFSEALGTFRGIIYRGTDTKPGWVYIVGRNDSLRLVHIADASVTYAEEFPENEKVALPAKILRPGVEVRVTAAQDNKGQWRATEVEIITVPKDEQK